MKGKFGIFFPYVISKIGRQIIKETAVFIKVFRKSSGAVDTVVGAINIHAGIFVAQIEKGRKFSLLFQIIFGVRHRIFFCMVIKILKKIIMGFRNRYYSHMSCGICGFPFVLPEKLK